MIADSGARYGREIERLYQLEFGDVKELSFRLIGTFVGAIVIWHYTGWVSTWIWSGGFNALLLWYFLFLRAKRDQPKVRDVVIAQATFPLLLISYIWMPIMMIVSPDDALSVSGFCILGGIIVFTVRRSEEYFQLVLIESGILVASLFVGCAVIMLRYDNPVVWLGLSGSVVALAFYMFQAAFIVRHYRLRADQAATRSGQAQKLEAIGQLAGGVAHDFNNILTAILGNLDLIEEIDDPVLQKELLAEARAAGRRGAQVVNQLLIYARQRDGKPGQIDATSVLQSVQALCRTLVPSSVTLRVQPMAADLSMRADESLFVAALLNLIKNGVDAVDGSGVVSVACAARHLVDPLPCAGGQLLLPGEYVAFTVADSGPGIPAADLQRVTDPFFTTKVVGNGSGLGLSMVVGFAQKAGGGLEITSTTDGTVMTVVLPRVIDTE